MNRFCLQCRTVIEPSAVAWACPRCGGLLDFELASAASRPFRGQGLWRYAEMLPTEVRGVKLGPDFAAARRQIQVDGAVVELWLEGMGPTGTFKDRGAAVMLAAVQIHDVTAVVEDSSGNAGAAVACYAAAAGVECEIFAPTNAPDSKLRRIRQYGAKLSLTDGSREDVAAACHRRAADVYYASHVWDPYFVQGTKLAAYEIWERFPGRLPEAILLPVGNGSLLLGLARGFAELQAAGLVTSCPRLIAVQSEHVPALSDDVTPHPGETIADGIRIARPVRRLQIREAIAATGGEVRTVSDERIRAAQTMLSRGGINVEPTAAVGVAGWNPGDRSALVVLTSANPDVPGANNG